MTIQTEIIGALNVSVSFEAPRETVGRTRFLSDYMERSGLRAFILGISGGIDSLTAGLLAQSAVRTLRERSYDSEFVAVRLPYGTQADEADAQLALQAIKPDRTVTINVKPATDNIWQEVLNAGLAPADPSERDLVLGNIKARQRMVAQFALAGSLRGLVIGTDHAAEAVMGFFTKFGDGAADLLPLAGLNKRRVRAIASYLGAPAKLIGKVPTADLDDGAPLRPDEDVYGVTYDQIDDFLEGKAVTQSVAGTIASAYRATAHKRTLPVAHSSRSGRQER
ncbi:MULTISPECIES: ammonia-dependent NAD(+) synthetase [Pseudomonadota]|jgi:NAD+ synthase|uniref:NH(3)-dependent NAD(+) synthetase n=1 Tax=Paracoccus yeei TaxID=147645 RepID=A0A2D2BZ65_9RHOB|nr:ammonia-dependent NAD(+) synthetase [Paracoccus yeei]ATQ55552.1 NAD(+) synthase [Paracoccus yeei]AYE99707.1 ammonia-dependent NAD(+) synthetase [Paracoccus yeei]